MEYVIPQWIVVVFGYLLALVTSLRIVLQRREPTATLAWVLGVILVPYIGVLVYLLIGRRRLNRQVRRRRAHTSQIEEHLDRQLRATPQEELLAPATNNVLARLSSRIGCRWPTVGNRVDLLVNADQTYEAMEQAIRDARDHIHFQFYIVQSDHTGRRFCELLRQKALEGVEVRLLTDGVGSFGLSTFVIPLLQAGGKHAEFLPVGRISRHWHPNLRNHRKIIVVDGKVGFTGGLNIGDEYTGRKRKVGHWRDTHLRIEGPAVAHLQEVFAEDWHFATEEEPQPGWFPQIPSCGEAMVHIVASGPDHDTHPIHRIFFSAMNAATDRLYLTTPYFVPDAAVLMALETAALRGADVRLLFPQRADSVLVRHAGRSYYDQLLAAGVRIFEYKPGMLHAKTMVVDRSWATVGSANMDVRSFQLNFEVNAAVYGETFAEQLAQVFMDDLSKAHEVSVADLQQRSIGQRMAESFARILSPVL